MASRRSRNATISRECEFWWFDIWDALVNRAIAIAGRPRANAGKGEIAIDPHLHTLGSHCSITDPERVLTCAAAAGLQAVGIMDHNNPKGALAVMECASEMKEEGALPADFTVVPGVEVNSAGGHIGALFTTASFPLSVEPAKLVDAIHEAGGLAVAVHPYHSMGVGDAVYDLAFDLIEVECGAVFDPKTVKRIRALAHDPRLARVGKIGASDAHYAGAIAACYTTVKSESGSLDKLRAAMSSGLTEPHDTASYRRISKLLGRISKLR